MTNLINISFLGQSYALKLQLNSDWIDVFIDGLPLINVKGLERAEIHIHKRLCEYMNKYVITDKDMIAYVEFKQDIKKHIKASINQFNNERKGT